MRRDLGVALLLMAPIVWFFRIGHAVAGDAVSRFEQLDALVQHGYTMPRAHSLIMPLFSLPMYMLGSVSHDAEWWCARFNVVVLAAFLALMWRALRHESAEGRITFLLLVAATSMIPKHMQGYYGEVFSTCAVAWGVALVMARHNAWGWLPIAIGVANAPALLPAMGLLALWRLWETRGVTGSLATVGAFMLYAAENYVKRGDPLANGHMLTPPFERIPLLASTMTEGFHLPMWIGLYGLLFSVGKGIMWFCPGLWLFLWRPRGMSVDFSKGMHVFLLGLVATYANWTVWHAGWYWGPRYLLFACIPSAWLIAYYVRVKRREIPYAGANILSLAVITLACWVGFTGATFGQNGMELCADNEIGLQFLCWYVPDWSALYRPFFRGPERMDANHWTVAIYIASVWAWLSWPIVKSLWWDVTDAWDTLAIRWRDGLRW